jgi:regulator of protease activity HflC (stomatin/prohibitin superfamily)
MIQTRKGTAGIFFAVFIAVFFIGGIILLMGIDTVDASHKGIMVNFGTIKGVMEPGIKWTGLFTHTYQYDMRIRRATEQEMDVVYHSILNDINNEIGVLK